MESQEEVIKLLAKNIKEIRKKRFKTQDLFAKHTGMTYSKYARFEKSGQISFDGFIGILKGLDMLDGFMSLFKSSSLFEVVPSVKVLEEKPQELSTYIPAREISIKIEENADDHNADIKRVVTIFDQERRKLQSNFVRKEYRNVDGQYLLRMHMKETGRTPKMFFDAIRWLFSNNPKAAFPRQYIMNIGKLIEHFNTLEHQAMYSEEAVAFNDEARAWYNVYKKQGMPEEEILEKLREGEYIK
jgi:transcriptional regulator with XRE-family HTH domain